MLRVSTIRTGAAGGGGGSGATGAAATGAGGTGVGSGAAAGAAATGGAGLKPPALSLARLGSVRARALVAGSVTELAAGPAARQRALSLPYCLVLPGWNYRNENMTRGKDRRRKKAKRICACEFSLCVL